MNNAAYRTVRRLSLELGAARIQHVTKQDVKTLLMTDKTIEEDHLSLNTKKRVISSEFTV
jgi:hypothetical protein